MTQHIFRELKICKIGYTVFIMNSINLNYSSSKFCGDYSSFFHVFRLLRYIISSFIILSAKSFYSPFLRERQNIWSALFQSSNTSFSLCKKMSWAAHLWLTSCWGTPLFDESGPCLLPCSSRCVMHGRAPLSKCSFNSHKGECGGKTEGASKPCGEERHRDKCHF